MIEEIIKRRNDRELGKYGRILTDEERDEVLDRERREEEEEARRRRIVANLEAFKVPKRFRNARFDTTECASAKERSVIEYLKKGRSAVIYGPNGTGKTHLAFASCIHQIAGGKTAKYVLAFDLFNSIRRSFGDSTTDTLVNEFASYDYLVIDEIDKTLGTPTEFTYLYSIINARYNDMKSTVLITNATPSEFVAIIGQSALDRVASDGAVIELFGENYRLRRDK